MNHRYRLAHSKEIKRNRWNNVCPACGRRGKFSPYIDTVTNEPIAAKECGRCCRERSCAYHMTPKEWFKDNSSEKREWLPREQYVALMQQRRREARVASPPALSQGEGASSAMPVSPLLGPTRKSVGCDDENFSSPKESRLRVLKGEAASYLFHMSTLCHKSRSDKNNLARWLCTLFPEEQVAEVLARYRTGSTRDGRIIYWQIDHRGQVRAGKVMAYDPKTGHRVKDNVGWVHSIRIDGIRFDEMLTPQCLFGLHLASPLRLPRRGDSNTARQDSPPWEGLGEASPCLVESEKTALIMSLVCPDKVWLATGGKSNFKTSMLEVLVGCEVAVYPDADALPDWYTRAMELNGQIGTHLYIPTWYYDLMNHPEARSSGCDLADMVCERWAVRVER